MCPEFHQINRKGHKSPTKIIKTNLDVENADGLGVKTRMKRDKEGAKFTWKWMCPEFHQISRKGQVTNKDYQNYLGCWKSWSFGVETTMKKDKQGAKFTWKLMCPEFHQINGKGQVTNRDFENQLECWKCWWFRSKKQENKGQRVVKSFKKINASRIPHNQWKRLSCKQRLFKLTYMLKMPMV